jgi:hypothetical protein
MGEYDRSSKWLIQHHGDSILKLAGVEEVVSWRALPAEVVQPGQLPDGVIEALHTDSDEPAWYVVEIATYPERRVQDQLLRDALLVFLDRRVLPEVVALVLHPKGSYQPPEVLSIQSPRGWTELNVRWRIVELWTLSAEDLLATNDPGLMPWVPLTQIHGPIEPVFKQCRTVIERYGSDEEKSSLLAVAQVLASLRYNDPSLLFLLGGRKAMIESPVLQEILAETRAEARAEATLDALFSVLRGRFEAVPPDLIATLQSIRNNEELKRLVELAARCPDFATFRTNLHS